LQRERCRHGARGGDSEHDAAHAVSSVKENKSPNLRRTFPRSAQVQEGRTSARAGAAMIATPSR
jgi:hypothetical protein